MPGLQPRSTASPLYYLAGYSVSLAGIALTAWYDGRGGLRRVGQRPIPWRSAAKLAFVLPAIVGADATEHE